ncbi:MAG: winged-helix domain-containing protein [Promethearchaeota archaeon]
MLDLLASTGTKEILEFIRNQSQPISSSDINKHFTKESSDSLTTATVYRRLKELELVGFIIRQPPDSNTFVITPQAEDILDRQILQHPEITELKRSHRALLHQIKQHKDANVVELQKVAQMSPTTINVGLQKLSNLGLIEQIKSKPKKIKPEFPLEKKTMGGPGRPKKRHRLTKKGEMVYKVQKKLEQAK